MPVGREKGLGPPSQSAGIASATGTIARVYAQPMNRSYAVPKLRKSLSP